MSKRKLELQDALKAHDLTLTEARAALDNHARGRRYKEFAAVAAEAARVATIAAAKATELDQLLEEDWKQRTGKG